MRCPKCEAASRVLETREPKRRRVCENGHKFSTVEVPVGLIQMHRAESVRLARLRLLINEGLK